MHLRRILTAALAILAVAFDRLPCADAQTNGVVFDAQTFQPIAGASVRAQLTELVTTTAADGSWSLPNMTRDGLVVAAKPGYWNSGVFAPVGTGGVAVPLSLLPSGDDPGYTFTPSDDCRKCHLNVGVQWNAAPMAHSGENTWLHDLFAGNGTTHGSSGFVYTRDSKHRVANPDGDCASCHVPVLFAQNQNGDTPLADPANPPDAQLAGVSCDLCHRMESVHLGTAFDFPGIHPAKVTFRRPPGATSPIMFGPWDDTEFTVKEMRPSFNPLFQTAELCALCHQDRNDADDDGDYGDPGSILHQNTYGEWLASPFAQPGPQFRDCVDCHMAPNGDTEACVFGPARPEGQYHAHTFDGSTSELLATSVELKLQAFRSGGEVRATVTLTNNRTGHAVPSGSDFRNLVLLVRAVDLAGNTLAYLGPNYVNVLGGVGDPAQGAYWNQPGKLYGKVNSDGTFPAQFFSEAVKLLGDNRLFPQQPDRTEYRFTMPAGATYARVDARLIYRRAWHWMDQVKRWEYTGHGDPNPDVQAPHFGTLMAFQRVILK